MLSEWLQAVSATCLLAVKEMLKLGPEQGALVGTPVSCRDHVEPTQWSYALLYRREAHPVMLLMH